MLDSRDLEVVLAVAAAGSTTKAAAKLHRTQSAVSRALCLTEEKLGIRLFERRSHGLVPTSAGQKLVEGAGPLLAQLVELERSIIGVPELRRVRLVCECYTAYRWLPSMLAALRRKVPALEVTIAVEHTQDPVAALRDGEIDVALLTHASVKGVRGIAEKPLFDDEILFIVSTAHPLASRRSVTPADLETNMLVTSAPESEGRWFVREVFGRRRPKLSFMRLPLTEAVVDAARAGLGIAVLSEWITSAYLEAGDLVAKRLSRGPLRRPWRIASRDEIAEDAAELASVLRASAPRLQTRVVPALAIR